MIRKFCSTLIFLSPSIFGANQYTMFGVTVNWDAETSEKATAIQAALSQMNKEGREYFDPDCRWRSPLPSGICENHFTAKTAELDRLAQSFRQETLGYFDVLYEKKKNPKRDFGGLWEGFVLDSLKVNIPGRWVVDVAGDILVRDSSVTKTSIVISDPVFDSVPYATVKLKSGYINTSVSSRLGSKVITPEDVSDKASSEGEILKIVIFASDDLSGARAHAWATGVIAGGEKVLKHLRTLKQYEGKWGYFYFHPDGTPVCSGNLQCQLDGPDRKILAQF